jgi:hypothetical protein
MNEQMKNAAKIERFQHCISLQSADTKMERHRK